MLQAPFPVNAARAGDLRAVTAWRQRCATTEANPVDARFPFDEWRPLQLACAEGDAAAPAARIVSTAAASPALAPPEAGGNPHGLMTLGDFSTKVAAPAPAPPKSSGRGRGRRARGRGRGRTKGTGKPKSYENEFPTL